MKNLKELEDKFEQINIMEEPNEPIVVYPPNNQFDRKLEFATKPTVYDYLLYIDFSDVGECILGSNRLNSTFWESCTLYFKHPEDVCELKYNYHYIFSTCSDGKFLNEEYLVLAHDTGLLDLVKIDRENNYLLSKNYICNANRIPQISTWKGSSNVLLCCGNDVAIWDARMDANREPPYSFTNYRNYHGGTVNSVDALKEDTNIFVSASSDRKSCLWDIRSTKATVIYENEFCSLTSIAWNVSNENEVFIGTEGGDVYQVDKREPGQFVSVQHCFDSTVHRIRSSNKDRFAVCGDTSEVIIFNAKPSVKVLEKSSKHTNVVRDLAWFGDDLYSCGFNKEVIKHFVQ